MESCEATLSLCPSKPSVVVAMAQTTRKSEPQVSLDILSSVSWSQYQCSLIHSSEGLRDMDGGVAVLRVLPCVWLVTEPAEPWDRHLLVGHPLL